MSDDRALTDPIGVAIWRLALGALVNDAALRQETFATWLMRVWADEPALTDSEGFERFLRGLLTKWWPELQRRAGVMRAAGFVSGVVVLPPDS